MNLRYLEHWPALAETGSFNRTAEKLHITQSALSRGIQALKWAWVGRWWIGWVKK